MRSPQVKNVIKDAVDRTCYSDLQVLKSGGWYIGTLYRNPEGFTEPGSRDSQYFPTMESAQIAFDTNDWTQRHMP